MKNSNSSFSIHRACRLSQSFLLGLSARAVKGLRMKAVERPPSAARSYLSFSLRCRATTDGRRLRMSWNRANSSAFHMLSLKETGCPARTRDRCHSRACSRQEEAAEDSYWDRAISGDSRRLKPFRHLAKPRGMTLFHDRNRPDTTADARTNGRSPSIPSSSASFDSASSSSRGEGAGPGWSDGSMAAFSAWSVCHGTRKQA
jgi:hypothetical protein